MVKHAVEEEEYFVRALQVIQSGGLPMVLKAACELDVFGIMAKAGPDCQLSAKQIADELPNNRNPDAASMLDRMLHLLTTHSIVTCSLSSNTDGRFQRHYGLNPLSSLFIPDENNLSLGPFLGLVEDDIVRAHSFMPNHHYFPTTGRRVWVTRHCSSPTAGVLCA